MVEPPSVCHACTLDTFLTGTVINPHVGVGSMRMETTAKRGDVPDCTEA